MARRIRIRRSTRQLARLGAIVLAGTIAGCGNGGNGLVGNNGGSGGNEGEDIVTTSALALSETQIRAVGIDGDLVVVVPLERVGARDVRADVILQVRRLDGSLIDQATESVQVTADGAEARITFPGFRELPEGTADSGDLADLVLHYRVEHGDDAIRGRRSLFTAFEKQEVHVLAASELNVDGETFVRVLAREPVSGRAYANTPVRISLQREGEDARELFAGVTDEFGVIAAPIDVEEADIGDQDLVVTIETGDTEETIRTGIEVARNERIMLTTDKPVYQPGQRIHVRTLSLSRPSLSPAADRPVMFEVSDAEGNKVFRQTLDTNEFGVASLEIPLATELNQGNWTISATMDGVTTERTVRVERYALPKYGVDLIADRTHYRPGDTATIDIDAQYFFGQPVAGGTVLVQPYTFDVGFNELAPIETTLDENGLARVEVPIPDFLVGQELNQGNAFVRVDVTVTDATDHQETATRNLVVAEQDVLQSIIPAADLLPGRSNTFYVLTRTPAGHPVATSSVLTVDGTDYPFDTNELGFAEIVVDIPEDTTAFAMSLASTDPADRVARADFTFTLSDGGSAIAVLSDGALYEVGESMELTFLTGANAPRVFVDVIRDGQTLLTQTVEMTEGRGEYTLDLSADLTGALQIDVYYVTTDARIVRGKRLVYVEGAGDLSIRYETDRDEYLPGEDAELDISVTDAEGRGVQSAIGLTIVDEAVFALQDMRPGLERIYFQLEEELLQPQYHIYGYSFEDVVSIGETDDVERETAAEVVMAATEATGYGIVINSLEPAMNNAKSITTSFFQTDVERGADSVRELVEDGFITDEMWNARADIEEAFGRMDPVFDAWGQLVRVELLGYYEEDPGIGYVVFSSAGLDETWGTEDDLSRSYDRYMFSSWMMDNERGDWDDDFAFDGAAGGGGGEPMPGPPNGEGDAMSPTEETEGESGGGDAPRVRSYFPETLQVEPNIITDEDGRYTLPVTVADSITTWRVTGMASSADGQLGSGTAGIRVFQPFFVDINFPVELTQNDTVSVPVALFNYLDEPQTVELRVDMDASGDWFELLSDATVSVDLDPGEITVRYFDVNVERVGYHPFQVTAIGSEMSDAIRRSVRIAPDGQRQEINVSDRLNRDVTTSISIPAEAIDEASNILVKVYPGLFSQVVEGLDSLLRQPSGCFEQTSSTTYPNVLVLNYMQQTGLATPEVELQATEYIAQGYQRLVSYEVSGGGFEWFGNDPAHRILTAYGLLEFSDMAAVFPVEDALIDRTQAWLLSQQESDGRWQAAPEGIHEGATNNFQDSDVRATAYITYALLESGATDSAVQRGVTWVRNNMSDVDDAYSLGMIANMFIAAGDRDSARSILNDLEDAKLSEETESGPVYWWESNSESLYYSAGNSMHMETTALILQAYIRAGVYPNTVQGAVGYLIQGKDSFGNFSSTQATILTLRAFIELLENSTPDVEATIRVLAGELELDVFELDETNSDLLRQVNLADYVGTVPEGTTDITIEFDGTGELLYQVIGSYYLPWDMVDAAGSSDTLTIEMEYDRTELAIDETVEVSATVTNQTNGRLDMVMLDLGIPPGFEVVMSDFDSMIEDPEIPVSRVERAGRQLTVYLYGLDPSEVLTLTYHLQATMVVEAQTPPSSAWLYYESDVRTESEPIALEVR